MPVNTLFVEGKLDAEVLTAVLAGRPLVSREGTKTSLKAKTLSERARTKSDIRYLRDRDFDFAPPTTRDVPCVHATDKGLPLGWYWSRHEMENYLLEPALVCAACPIESDEYVDALRTAASEIRFYQAARATVGEVRAALPPNHELRTRPEEVGEAGLPASLEEASCLGWLLSSCAEHARRIVPLFEESALRERFSAHLASYSSPVEVGEILVRWAGKDLFDALADWLNGRGFNAGSFKARIRDYVVDRPADVLAALPEWRQLATFLQS